MNVKKEFRRYTSNNKGKIFFGTRRDGMKRKMDKNWQNFCNWVTYLSLLGTFGSCCNLAFQVAAAKHWSFYLLIYSLIPFCWFGLIYICCYCLVKKRFGYSVPYCNENTRKIVFGLMAIFITANLIVCNVFLTTNSDCTYFGKKT